MKTGNGSTPNHGKCFGATPRKETSNVVKPKTAAPFSAKQDAYKGKK